MARAGAAALGLAMLGAMAFGTGGCSRSDGQSASVPAPAGGAADHGYGGGHGGDGYAEAADRPPVPLFHGEPVWSESRAHSAQESAEYHFRRDGADLGAKTLDEFLTRVHRFGDHPPPGTLKLTRANGDRLLYDPKANLFGVFTRQGAPRTVFKPNQGMAYWTEQKQRLASGDDGYRSRSYAGGGYGGHGGSGGGGGEGE